MTALTRSVAIGVSFSQHGLTLPHDVADIIKYHTKIGEEIDTRQFHIDRRKQYSSNSIRKLLVDTDDNSVEEKMYERWVEHIQFGAQLRKNLKEHIKIYNRRTDPTCSFFTHMSRSTYATVRPSKGKFIPKRVEGMRKCYEETTQQTEIFWITPDKGFEWEQGYWGWI
tara:strand:+ start:376 stop:879 length:504 start_codon:yes stop_codon:yes gene_type:complete